MKVAIVGAKTITKAQVLEAIQASTFNIDGLITASNTEIDNILDEYANAKNITIDSYDIQWNNLDGDNVVIATNNWGKQYNKNAPIQRTNQIVEDCDAMIILDDDEIEANLSKRKIEQSGKPFYIKPLKQKSLGSLQADDAGYIHYF